MKTFLISAAVLFVVTIFGGLALVGNQDAKRVRCERVCTAAHGGYRDDNDPWRKCEAACELRED